MPEPASLSSSSAYQRDPDLIWVVEHPDELDADVAAATKYLANNAAPLFGWGRPQDVGQRLYLLGVIQAQPKASPVYQTLVASLTGAC